MKKDTERGGDPQVGVTSIAVKLTPLDHRPQPITVQLVTILCCEVYNVSRLLYLILMHIVIYTYIHTYIAYNLLHSKI